jgi:hypothetical protein
MRNLKGARAKYKAWWRSTTPRLAMSPDDKMRNSLEHSNIFVQRTELATVQRTELAMLFALPLKIVPMPVTLGYGTSGGTTCANTLGIIRAPLSIGKWVVSSCATSGGFGVCGKWRVSRCKSSVR